MGAYNRECEQVLMELVVVTVKKMLLNGTPAACGYPKEEACLGTPSLLILAVPFFFFFLFLSCSLHLVLFVFLLLFTESSFFVTEVNIDH